MKKAIKIDQGSKLALNKMEREGRSINRHADRTDCQEQRLKVSKIPWLDDIISRRGGTKGRNIANQFEIDYHLKIVFSSQAFAD